MNQFIRLLGLCGLVFVLIGCSGGADAPKPAATQPPSASTPLPPPSKPPAATAPATASRAPAATAPATASTAPAAPTAGSSASSAQACPVTMPNGSTPPNQNPSPLFYGNDVLWTSLWTNGKVVFGPSGPGQIGTDGTLSIQWPWWRGVQGVLAMEGKRMDASVPPMKAIVPDSFGLTGFQATTLVFSSEGCWQVTGRVGTASLTFVTLLEKTK